MVVEGNKDEDPAVAVVVAVVEATGEYEQCGKHDHGEQGSESELVKVAVGKHAGACPRLLLKEWFKNVSFD